MTSSPTTQQTIARLQAAVEDVPIPWETAREQSSVEMHTEDWQQDEIDGLRRIVEAVRAALTPEGR